MSAETLSFRPRKDQGQTLEQSVTVMFWQAAYLESIGMPASAQSVRKSAKQISAYGVKS